MVVLFALFLGLQSQIALALERSHSALWMDFQEGRLSLEVREGSWENVLQELRQRTGIHLHLHIRLKGPLSISFKELPIERALRRLFGPEANFIFWYPAAHTVKTASDRPTEVWVIGKTGDAPTSRPPSSDAPEAPALALPGQPDHVPELGHDRRLSPGEVQVAKGRAGVAVQQRLERLPVVLQALLGESLEVAFAARDRLAYGHARLHR